MRARSVFTATTISPSPPLRQRSACYTIRARRNFTLVPLFRGGVDYSFPPTNCGGPACDHQCCNYLASGDLILADSVVTGSPPTNCGGDFPRYYPAITHRVLDARLRRGLHRYQPVRACVCLPDKEFRYLRTVRAVTTLASGGIAYPLCILLCRSDYLIVGCQARRLAYSL